MKPDHRLINLTSIACLVLLCGHITGCGSEEEEAAAPPPVTAPAGPRYAVQDLQMNVMVQFPEKYAPDSEALAQAIADFAGAIATGDASAFGDMLSETDRALLRADLVPSGRWAESTGEISAVRIVNLNDGESIAQVAIAIGTDEDAYLTAWSVRRTSGDQWQFTALPVAPRTTTRVAMLDDAGFENDVLVGAFTPPAEEPVPVPEEQDGDDFGDGDDFSIPPSQPSSPVSPGFR